MVRVDLIVNISGTTVRITDMMSNDYLIVKPMSRFVVSPPLEIGQVTITDEGYTRGVPASVRRRIFFWCLKPDFLTLNEPLKPLENLKRKYYDNVTWRVEIFPLREAEQYLNMGSGFDLNSPQIARTVDQKW